MSSFVCFSICENYCTLSTYSAEVNSACAKVLAFGQNTCTAQKRRRPEGRFSEMLYLFRMHMPSQKLHFGLALQG